MFYRTSSGNELLLIRSDYRRRQMIFSRTDQKIIDWGNHTLWA